WSNSASTRPTSPPTCASATSPAKALTSAHCQPSSRSSAHETHEPTSLRAPVDGRPVQHRARTARHLSGHPFCPPVALGCRVVLQRPRTARRLRKPLCLRFPQYFERIRPTLVRNRTGWPRRGRKRGVCHRRTLPNHGRPHLVHL